MTDHDAPPARPTSSSFRPRAGRRVHAQVPPLRSVAILALLGALVSGCSTNAGELAPEMAGSENRITFDELTEAVLDPEADLDFAQVDGIDLEELTPMSTTFCEAFAAVPVTWVDDALVPIQLFLDAWKPVGDVPAEVADDVDALVTHAERKLDWHFGRIDRNDRPTDPRLFERLERLADEAVARCDRLPPRIGHPDDWALQRSWEPGELERRCAQSLADAEEGIALYHELRGREPGHAIQVELASLADWLRSADSDDPSPLWFVPELHGIDASSGSARVIALPGCEPG